MKILSLIKLIVLAGCLILLLMTWFGKFSLDKEFTDMILLGLFAMNYDSYTTNMEKKK